MTDVNDVCHQDINTLHDLSFIDVNQIKSATKEDETLSKICWYVQKSWPNEISDDILQYYNRRLMLTVENEYV